MTPLMDFTGFISEEGNRVIPRKPGGKKEGIPIFDLGEDDLSGEKSMVSCPKNPPGVIKEDRGQNAKACPGFEQ